MRRSARILTVTLAIGALPAAAQSGYTEHRAVDVQEVQRLGTRTRASRRRGWSRTGSPR